MAKTRYASNSLIQSTGSVEPVHFATWQPPPSLQGYRPDEILEGQTVVEYTWQFGDRLDRLAHQYLGEDQYWWMIAYANQIVYPLSIKVGTVLRIPRAPRPILEKLGLI